MAESMQNVHTNVGSMWEKAPRSLRNNREKYYGISWMLFISMEGSFSCNTMHTISTFLYLVLLSLKSIISRQTKVTNMTHNQDGDLHTFPQELPHIIGEVANWEEPLSTDCISYNFIICLPLVCTTLNVMKASIPTFEDLLYHIMSFRSGKVEDDTKCLNLESQSPHLQPKKYWQIFLTRPWNWSQNDSQRCDATLDINY